MNKHKNEHNWWIDVVLFAGYLFCFALDLTSLVGHEWLGLGVGLLGLVHLLVHGKWVAQVLNRFIRGASGRNRLYMILDVLLAVGFLGILLTGLAISTWLILSLNDYATWLNLHVSISIVTLLVTLVKIGFHWRWVSCTTTKIFNNPPKPRFGSADGLVLSPQPVRVDESRRKFLAIMGVVGLGSTLALLNLRDDESLASAAASDGNVALEQADATALSGGSIPADPEAAVVATEPASPTVTLEDSQVTATAQPTGSVCTVRCNRGCSFPGYCRRYVDQDGNGKCDLGECL